MRQKVANQNIKKNFILYKGHTGWKIKTRIFGTLLVGLSAMTIAESTGAIDAHADTGTGTGTPSADTASQSSAPKMAGTTTLKTGTTDGTTPEAQTSQKSVAQTPVTTQSDMPAPVSAETESVSVNDTTTGTTNDATTDKQYQTLTPDQPMAVGKTDGSGVTLSGSQVQDHFTNTVQNFNKKGEAGDVTQNKTAQPADENGVWQLTSNDPHLFTGTQDPTFHMKVTGPQTAHVSFENDIDFGHDFTLTGALGIGTKTSGGADGVGIVFAPGDPEYATTGLTGGNLGIGGLNNAFAFVYDDHYNAGDDTSGVVDPGNSAYFGWRSTDASGAIQKVTNANDWKAASAFDLSNRATNPLLDFTMTYDSFNKVLTIIIQGQKFTRSLADIDTSKGYSISIAASTGQDSNDYSARIDSFTYTPKTTSVNVKVATAAGDVSTTTPVTANIGDTISVFSTKEAAERAVAADPTLDPSLVTVIPASTTSNVYLVDGDNTTASNGTVGHITGEESNADAAYYSYKVTGDATQAFSVPVAQAFKANVTPVDSVTKKAIPGMDPIQVTTVAGKSVVVQVPGYTPVTVTLDAPAAGETVANDTVLINTGTTPSTDPAVANPVEHYYTATGETMDGTKVTASATVGTNQSVTDALNATPIGEDGKAVTDGSTPAYTWSTVPDASATDSTDSTTPQDSKSILVPTKATLDKWLQKASDNQTDADGYQKQAQDIYDKFVGLTGITPEQKAAAQKLLDSVNGMYAQLSTDNATAKDDLQAAEDATDPETIFEKGQAGYNAMANMDDTLKTFEDDLKNLTTTNNAAVASLATFIPWSRVYGDTSLGYPEPTVGDGFGATLTDAQKAGFSNPDYFYFVDAAGSDTHVTPKDVGVYYVMLTDAGRAYLKSLTTNTNAGLYTSATLTITAADATPTITKASLQYGGVGGKLSLDNIDYDLGTVAGDDDPQLNLTSDDFEIDDTNGNKVEINKLQVGGTYTIRYSDNAQTALKNDKNYNFVNFGTATLTVTPRKVSIAAADAGKTYGDSTDPALSLDADSATAALVNGDDVSSLDADLTRETGENAGSYKISGTATGNKNYFVTVNDGTFTIAKKAVTVKANDVNADYDGTTHQVDQSGFTIADGDQLATGDTAANLDVTLTPSAETDAGTYTIKGSSTASNYAVTVLDGTLTIAQKDGTITADEATVGYGDALPIFTVTNSDTGLKTTLDNTDFEIFDNNAKAIATGQLQAGGDYTIQLTQAAQESLKAANPNYKLSFVANKLTVTQREITVHIEDGGKDYGVTNDPALKFTIPATTATGEANGTLVDPDTQDKLGVTLTRVAGDNAGPYTITGTAANVGNYKVSIENDGTFTIAPISGTATVAATSVVYGDNLPSINVTVNGTTSALGANNFEIVNGKGAVVTADQLQAGGSYTLQLTDTAKDTLRKANSNYTLDFVAGGLTVTKRPITVQINNVDTTYDGTTHGANGFSVAKDDKLVDGDSDDALGVTLDPISETDAGTYKITGKTDSANYDVKLVNGTLTIGQATGKVAVTGTSVDYGESLPSLAVSVNGADASKLSADNFEIIDTTTNSVVKATDLQAGGSYKVQLTQTAQDALSKATPNYKLSFGTDVLTVNKKPITVQINNVDATYDGTAHGANGFSIAKDDKLVDGDSDDALGVTLDPISETDAGTYKITGKADSANYDVKLVNGTLKIDQVKRNVTVENAKFIQGDQSLPKLSATINVPNNTIAQSDFEIIDNATGKSVTAADLQAGGNYKIQLNQAAETRLAQENPNYDVDVVSGQLTVLSKVIDVNHNVTITEKDLAGNVVKIDKQWTDGSQTTYTYNPATDERTVSEQKNGKQVDQQKLTPSAKITLSDDDNGTTSTIVALDPTTKQPTFEHDTTQTTKDDAGNVTATTKDDAGNVINVTKQWNDGSTTTYTYDPAQKTQTVTEQKDGKEVDKKTITSDDPTTATLKSGDGVETIVNTGQPGAEPTFKHDTTKTDGDTTTTTDANGNVIKVVKQWPDDSQTTYTYDPANGDLTVSEQKDGKTANQSITNTNKATVSAVDGIETIVDAGRPGSQPTFKHETTKTDGDTTTTTDANGNVIKVVKQWPDDSQTTYTYDPANGDRTVSEQKDGKTVDQLIAKGATKATVSAVDGVETIVDAGQPGSQPTFKHETTKTDGDTTTTTDANGNVIKVVKQWPDDSQTTYTYDPANGDRTVSEQKDGKTVDQPIAPGATKATVSAVDGAKTTVNTGQPGSQPTFEHDTTQTTKDDAGNITATTKDDAGNAINVTKKWTDGSTTTYTYDPATKTQTVTEQKDGNTVDSKTITPDDPTVTLKSGDGAETIVDATEPGAEPTFDHKTTQTTIDKSGNVTATTKDANGNVVKVVKQWTDGDTTTYSYDPTTGNRTVTEQKDGQTVDQQTIDPNTAKATLSAGKGVETIVNAGQPGSEPTFEHDTTQTATDKSGNVTATTKDADGNVVKVVKQWTDGDTTTYTYDPATGKRTVTVQRNGKTVAQQTIDPNTSEVTLADGIGGKIIVKFDKAGAEPSFTRQLAAKASSRQATSQNDGVSVPEQTTQGTTSAQSAASDITATGHVQSQQKTKPNQQQTELPQTGQKNESLLAGIGVALLALLATPFIRRRSH